MRARRWVSWMALACAGAGASVGASAGAGAGAGAFACSSPEPGEPARSNAAAVETAAAVATAAPVAALLVTPVGSSETSLMLQPVGGARAPAVASLRHVPDAEVRGALLPDGQRVVAVAQTDARKDPSWASSLFLLEAGKPAKLLADAVFHASRPLVLADGRVAVERGAAGPGHVDAPRVDALRVDVVSPSTGATETVHSWSGLTTHLCGALDDEVFVYRVGPGGADLVAVDVDGDGDGAPRVLADSIPAFARDFSVDAATRALVYTNRDDAGWRVVRLDLATLARTTVARADAVSVTPHVWRGGTVIVNDGQGAVALDGSLQRPLGAGFDELRALGAEHAAFLHRVPGRLPEPFVVDAAGVATPLPRPAGARVEIAGLVP